MKYLLFFCALLLASCARPNTPPPPQSEPIGLDSPIPLKLFPGDSGVAPQQVVRRRLFGLLPPKKVASSPEKVATDNLTGYKLPRKCKGCIFNTVAGNQNNSTVGKKATAATAEGATAITTAKKAGPVVLADSGADVKLAIAPKGQAAAGRDIHQEQPPDKSLLATIWDNYKPALLIVGVVLGLAALGLLLVNTPLWPWLLLLFKRRNKSTANQA